MKETPFSNPERLLSGVGHALDVLELLALRREELGLGEIARSLGLSKAGAHRLLATLSARGYADRLSGGFYRLGLKAWEIGNAVPELEVLAVAVPFVTDLAEATDESAFIGTLSGQDVVVLQSVETTQPVRAHLEVGSRYPAHWASTGLVILAFLSEGELAEHLPATLSVSTEATIASHEALRKELVKVRNRGYALNVGTWKSEISGIAAPIFGADGRIAAGLCISGPRYRLPLPRLQKIARDAKDIADRISAAMRDGKPSRQGQFPIRKAQR